MATKYWLGVLEPVKQVDTVQITAFDAATTYKITIGTVVVSVAGDTDVNTTATNLKNALEASVHPYFTAQDYTVATDTVTITAANAGNPFTATSSVTGGTGTIGAVTNSTANASPHDWNAGANWSDGSIPANSDIVVIRNSAINISIGLDQSAVDLAELRVERSFTGKVGLRSDAFATDRTGNSVDATAPEYRDHYLRIGYDLAHIGLDMLGGGFSGSSRVKIHQDKTGSATRAVVHNTSATTDNGQPAVRLLGGDASHNIEVRKAPGGVGIAMDEPAETMTVGDIDIGATTPDTHVHVGDGVTLTNFRQIGGTNMLSAAATVTLVRCDGGILSIEGGDYAITTLTINDGTVSDNHENGGSVVTTTVNLNNGTLDLSKTAKARTITTMNLDEGAVLKLNNFATITTLSPPGGVRTISVT